MTQSNDQEVDTLKKKAALKLGAESAALVRKRKSSSVEMPQSLTKQPQVGFCYILT